MSSERKVSVGPPPLRNATVELTTDATDEDDTAAHELGGMNLGLDAIESEDADASPPAPAPPAAAKRPKSTATRTRTGKASRRKPDQTERQTSTTGMTKTTVLLPSELWGGRTRMDSRVQSVQRGSGLDRSAPSLGDPRGHLRKGH